MGQMNHSGNWLSTVYAVRLYIGFLPSFFLEHNIWWQPVKNAILHAAFWIIFLGWLEAS